MSCVGGGVGWTHEEVEDKLMLEGLRAFSRERRALSWFEGSMVGPWCCWRSSWKKKLSDSGFHH